MAGDNGSEVPPPPPAVTEGTQTTVLVRSPWQWVLHRLDNLGMTEVESVADLPSRKLAAKISDDNGGITASMTPATRRRRQNKKDKVTATSTLKLEITEPETGAIVYAVHGTSSAFDGLEDKDELVRTIQRCRCDDLVLSPPSILINWDVTKEECLNLVGEHLPALASNQDDNIAVLKEPMGSQGKGIYFVKNAEEIHKVIDEHRQRALEEPAFLDNLISAKGRIPSWVLQAEVPSLLIKGGRKFHVRTYLVVVEQPHLPELLEMYIFNRHEIRIAGIPVGDNDKERNPLAHITNGALSDTTERVLLSDVPELLERDVQDRVETFVAATFGKHLLSDITRRVGYSLGQDEDPEVRKFAVAGLDLMITVDNKVFLLEANVNPAAPPESTVDGAFMEHLTGFMKELVDLVLGVPAPSFVNTLDILDQKGMLG